MENASYPMGICAERVAFGKAISEGHRKFKALAISTYMSISFSSNSNFIPELL